MAEEPRYADELGIAEFKPGWPDIAPVGVFSVRTSVGQKSRSPEDDVSADSIEESPVEVRWTMHLGLRDVVPRLALIGDLQVADEYSFGATTAIMPFELREEQEDYPQELRDGLLRQYGEWASSIVYDHAATVLRGSLALNGLDLQVPFWTPDVALHTSDFHDEDKASKDDAHGRGHA